MVISDNRKSQSFTSGGSLDKYGKIPEIVLGKVTASVCRIRRMYIPI